MPLFQWYNKISIHEVTSQWIVLYVKYFFCQYPTSHMQKRPLFKIENAYISIYYLTYVAYKNPFCSQCMYWRVNKLASLQSGCVYGFISMVLSRYENYQRLLRACIESFFMSMFWNERCNWHQLHNYLTNCSNF